LVLKRPAQCGGRERDSDDDEAGLEEYEQILSDATALIAPQLGWSAQRELTS
jgi:hypothetical protein